MNTNNTNLIPENVNVEEVMKLIRAYVSRHKLTYISVYNYYNGDVEDISSDVLLTILNRGALNSFNSKKANLGTYVSQITRNWLIDKLKFLKNNKDGITLSMDYDLSGGSSKSNLNSESSFQETLSDDSNNIDDIIDDEYIMKVLESLDELSDGLDSCVGDSPLTGDATLTSSILIKHLLAGYNLAEVAKFYTNKKTNKHLSRPALAKRLNNIKDDIYNVLTYTR